MKNRQKLVKTEEKKEAETSLNFVLTHRVGQDVNQNVVGSNKPFFLIFIQGRSARLAIMSTKMSMPLRKMDSWMNSLWWWRRTGVRWRGENPMAGTPT